MERTGYLGNQRVIINNHYDVSTQADIHAVALSYESEDETMSRLRGRRTPLYSKQDIREQYCISPRGLGALEAESGSLFGCLSSHRGSPCTRSSLLTACVKQKAPSDENLYELYRRHPAEYAPYPRRAARYPWAPLTPDIYKYDKDLKTSYFRRSVYSDPSRYTWMPSDDESVRMEKPKSVMEPAFLAETPPTMTRQKHVSFARSHTLTSFDDAIVALNSSSSFSSRMSKSQERLLDVRKTDLPITTQPEPSENVLILDKIKRTPMKTQATQTEACLGRRPLPLSKVTLSPSTIRRVKMVSQGAQTNGLLSSRRLTKSYSEAGGRFPQGLDELELLEHEPLTRTQSDEPPRSPFLVLSPQRLQKSPTPSPPPSSGEVSAAEDDDESKKEIFIDFKPLVPIEVKPGKRPLVKTASDGEILMEQRRAQSGDSVVPAMISASHDNILSEEPRRPLNLHFQQAPIRHEGICRHPLLKHTLYSSTSESIDGETVRPQDSIDEEFHENLIYDQSYIEEVSTSSKRHTPDVSIRLSPYSSDGIVPSICFDRRLSPFASNDSLSTDFRDHSDGIWNESQATVLQLDSGTENGTGLSSSDINSVTSPAAVALLTPSSRRKHLLMMQHQQRSSIDIEILDEEPMEQIQLDPYKEISFRPSRIVTQQKNTSPGTSTWRRRTTESPVESPLPAIVPDLLLARTDSCKTNTDMSESTTTTDDYITATSGTDSSRKSNSIKALDRFLPPHLESEGTLEFDSALGEDMVVPSFSSPFLLEDSSVTSTGITPSPGRTSPSNSSSSYGSYSVDGSCPDLLEKGGRRKGENGEERSKYRHGKNDDMGILKRKPHSSQEKTQTKESKTYLKETNNKTNEKTKHSKTRIKTNAARRSQPKRSLIPTNKIDISDNESLMKKSYERKISPDTLGYDLKVAAKLQISDETSPKKVKKSKENNRRKSLPRSPTYHQKTTKRDSIEDQSSSLPGSLSRRKTTKYPKPAQEHGNDVQEVYSPTECPGYKSHSTKISPNAASLKAHSAESLRSVSPGSDSVFYSDPSSHTADHQVHCLHCGKEVDIITTDDLSKSTSSREKQYTEGAVSKTTSSPRQSIVQPPAGFEDSPVQKSAPVRLYRKMDKRIRSEERSEIERKSRHKPDMRAKSEERDAKNGHRTKLRPMAKSVTASPDGLKATDSSPSVLPGAPEDDEDLGMYHAAYLDGVWMYLYTHLDDTITKFSSAGIDRRDSVASTDSEQNFCRRYQSVTHRMVHRRSCLEMYRRQSAKSFECDKTVVVRRESGEFGFRIHGSKPVVVSAIESATPAESSGLEVGDIVLSVNGISVLDKSHSEVVKIAHCGADTLTLEVARTSQALAPSDTSDTFPSEIYSGYLWKLSGYASDTADIKWVRRWFSLKEDRCLYYYKNACEKRPVGAFLILDHSVLVVPRDDSDICRPYRFALDKAPLVPLHLAADGGGEMGAWLEVLREAATGASSDPRDEILERTRALARLAPGDLGECDCFGYLVKLGTQWKPWSRRYCVLKDACLYFYHDSGAKSAFGVVFLHGYRVQQSSSGSKKYTFEVAPPDTGKKHFHFLAESENDRKRWIAALEYSIDKWLKLQ